MVVSVNRRNTTTVYRNSAGRSQLANTTIINCSTYAGSFGNRTIIYSKFTASSNFLNIALNDGYCTNIFDFIDTVNGDISIYRSLISGDIKPAIEAIDISAADVHSNTIFNLCCRVCLYSSIFTKLRRYVDIRVSNRHSICCESKCCVTNSKVSTGIIFFYEILVCRRCSNDFLCSPLCQRTRRTIRSKSIDRTINLIGSGLVLRQCVKRSRSRTRCYGIRCFTNLYGAFRKNDNFQISNAADTRRRTIGLRIGAGVTGGNKGRAGFGIV